VGHFYHGLNCPSAFLATQFTSSNLVFIPEGLSRVMKKVISMAHQLDFVCCLIKIQDFGNCVLEIGCVYSEVKKREACSFRHIR
jgi:hypothetical protein